MNEYQVGNWIRRFYIIFVLIKKVITLNGYSGVQLPSTSVIASHLFRRWPQNYPNRYELGRQTLLLSKCMWEIHSVNFIR